MSILTIDQPITKQTLVTRKQSSRKTSFFTIGYEQSTPEYFLELLHENEIAMIVDVRAVPLSRKKGFSKTQLQNLLSESGIQYMHLQTLGAPKQIRDALRETGSWWSYVKGYSRVLAERQTDIEFLTDLATKKRICLLCFERNPKECHRSLIAIEMEKAAANSELQVQHICC